VPDRRPGRADPAASRDRAAATGRGQIVLAPGGTGGTAFVSLDSGPNLEVSVPGGAAWGSPDDLIRVVDEMTIGSAPYVGWIWQR
jgi:hypothetical protein